MDHDFWHERWRNNEIGFHESDGNPYLKKYHNKIISADNNRVFVPLCGKTRDIAFLLAKNCEVIGAELSEIAIQQLFDELGISPEIVEKASFKLYRGPRISVFVGDIFNLTESELKGVTAIYDRAAIVALPSSLRSRYAAHLVKTCKNVKQLVLTFCYDQTKADGPPFSVDAKHLNSLYSSHYQVNELQRSAIEGGLKGKIDCDCIVFELTRFFVC